MDCMIPGLSFCGGDNVEGMGIDIPSFIGTTTIPESHRFGNCRKLEDFRREDTIHEGAFGVFYRCREKRTEQIYTLKKFKMPENSPDGFSKSALREANILCSLKHTNIANSHGPVAGRKIIESNFLLFDYCVLSLNDLIVKDCKAIYEREVVKSIMKQLFQGLQYIHEGSIVHRDICCRNILFTEDGLLKISGFRTARFLSEGNMTPGVTEVTYRAPELLLGTKTYTSAVDMWSLGCVFARLLLQKPLFTGKSEMEVLTSIFEILGNPSEAIWPGFSELPLLKEQKKMVDDGQLYSLLRNMLAGQSLSSKGLLQELIVYYPNARTTAEDGLKSAYFKDAVHECSQEDLASMIKENMKPETEPMKTGK